MRTEQAMISIREMPKSAMDRRIQRTNQRVCSRKISSAQVSSSANSSIALERGISALANPRSMRGYGERYDADETRRNKESSRAVGPVGKCLN